MRMDANTALFVLAGTPDRTLAAINERLAKSGVSLTREDALMLAARRTQSLADLERVEFGTPAVVTIAEAVAGSPRLTQSDAAETLAHLQDAFYSIREELPAEVPDEEIAEALRACLDELGDPDEVAAMPSDEVIAHSEEYMQALDAEREEEYRIVDDEGHSYTFDPSEWDYDETAPGWDGERWADDWDD